MPKNRLKKTIKRIRLITSSKSKKGIYLFYSTVIKYTNTLLLGSLLFLFNIAIHNAIVNKAFNL